jgi:hypothetical protein
MLRICQVMLISINMPSKFHDIVSFYSLGKYFGWRTKEDLGSYNLYIDFYFIYMVTYVVVNSVDCMCTSDVP